MMQLMQALMILTCRMNAPRVVLLILAALNGITILSCSISKVVGDSLILRTSVISSAEFSR
jgi:hypothetical protein